MKGGTRSGGMRLGEVKKRRRMVTSDSEEDRGDSESRLLSRSKEFDDRAVECGKDEVGWIGKKRKLDVFEFDEYDRFDKELILKRDCVGIDGEGSEEEGKTGGRTSEARQVDSEDETIGGKVVVYTRRNSFNSDSNRSISVRNKIAKQSVTRKADSIISCKKPGNSSLKSVNVQGKNGVLKVQVNNVNGQLDAQDYEPSKDEIVFAGNQLACASSVQEGRIDHQSGTVGRTGKAFLSLHRSLSVKTGHKQDLGFNDSDSSSKSGRDLDSSKPASRKRCKSNTAIPAPHKSAPAVSRSGEESSECRGVTEKQKLREHIKQMLLNAGWTIDYRPRKNRGYNDAVYVNTSGTSYWSIVKAYDALQREAEDKNKRITSLEDPSFTPLPETILCKLTRSARKRMEKENKLKYRKNGRSDRLNQVSVRSSKVKSDSEETSEEDEEDYEDDEEKLSPLDKKSLRSLKARNGLKCNSGSRHLSRFSHDDDLEYSDSNKSRLQLQARKNKKLGKFTLLVRSANKGMNPSDGYVPYTGKRTLLSWLIDCGTVKVSEKVRFMNRTRKRTLQQGWITRDGIHCVCCSKIIPIAKFEIHAGSKLRQPLQNIITESGTTLLQCLLDAWNQKAESDHNYFHHVDVDGDDPNDDTCGICGDGGDLICCDGCPSTFHQDCLGIEVLPAGDWHCPQCICMHCAMIGETHVNNDTTMSSMQTCSLCEMKYHFSCLKKVDSNADDSCYYPFCGTKCEELYKILQKSIGVRNELEEGFSWSLIRRAIVGSNDSVETTQKLECNAKLAIAQSIMDECFLPIVDRRSQVNLIHNVLFNCGSNFNRLNYKGFYTVILEKGDEVISAASLRFHGSQFAEMPFIGTRHIYRRQGMCRRLLSAIESALRSYNVDKLVIPAISELLHTWTEIFGFHHLEQSDKEKIRSLNMMVFPGVDMLQKVLIKKDRLKDEAVVETGLCDLNGDAADFMSQDSGALIIPSIHLDDMHPCSEPGNSIKDNANESCVDGGVATNQKSHAPDLSGSPDYPLRKELPDKDENAAPEIKPETKFLNAAYSNLADAHMEGGIISESFVVNGVQSAKEDDNKDVRGSCCAELGSSDGSCDIFIACKDIKTDSRPLELCTPPLPEDRHMLDEEVISNTPTHLETVTDENFVEVTVDATKSSTSTPPILVSSGDTDMVDAEAQKTPRDSPKEIDLRGVSSTISTAYTTSCTERDEDADMNLQPYTGTSTFPSDMVIGQ